MARAVASLNERKAVYAFSSGLMCSAACWIASQARAIYTTPSARVGSIGVVQAVIDDSAALASEGIKVEPVSSFSINFGPQQADKGDTPANKVFVTIECLYGFTSAKTDALKRIVKP